MNKEFCTIVQKAITTIDGFEKVFQVIYQQSVLQGKSKSTFNNYIRRIALLSLHFQALPEQISDEDIRDYLTGLALSSESPSRSSFKHMVYGLRFYFRHIGDNKRAICLPSIKKETSLPVILNREELKELFKAPIYLKHRIVLTLIYSAGLRAREVINLKLGDIDFERKTIHIRQSKYKKDRVVPLSSYMAKGLKKYIEVEHPAIWLFNGKELDGRYSVKGLSWIMRETLKKTTIQKQVNLHSLRHSYATHLLEEGVNIVVVKNLLGHTKIETTMVYLHVAQLPHIAPHSPLDTLYSIDK